MTQDLVVASNSVIFPYCHPTNGGGVFFSVKNLSVALGGQINAKGLGFAGPPAAGTLRSRGPGGPTTGSAYSPGAGHGGIGGSNSNTVPNIGGPIYGNSNAPIVAGSSGWSGQNIGGNGGGLIRVEASGSVTVDGVLDADGSSGGQFSGGGSGGAIYIRCRTFKGATTGRVLANGAKEGADASNGAGAGGRIAVWSSLNTFLGQAAATGAVHVFNATFPARSGGNGTVVWGVLKGTSGTLIQIR